MDQLFRDDDRTDHISLAEVVAAEPDAVFLDHVHPDQSRHAARIAVATGAVIVGAQEACDFVKRDATVKGLDSGRVRCNPVRDAAGKPFTGTGTWISPVEVPIVTPIGTTGKPALAAGDVDVTAVKLKHSQTRPYPGSLVGPGGYRPDMSPYQEGSSPQSFLDFVTSWDDDGSNLLWVVRYGDITFVKHGSTGPLDPLEPGAADIKAALRAPGATDRVDIEVGGIAELNNYVNGLVDARRYAAEVGAKVFLPIHHGNWAPPFTSEAATYYEPWKAEVGRIDAARRPDLCFLVEATRATVFDVRTGEWAGDARGRLEPLGGPGCHRG
jgi:L-ascorbate metabolism protein UlaG (beta-lactamase superfamily)